MTLTGLPPVLERIGRLAARLEIPAFVVGGYVRDRLLGRDTSGRDFDVVVLGDGVRFAHEVSHALGFRPVVTFERFGTAMIPIPTEHGGGQLEFVGARAESYAPDSRKPDVRPGTLAEDQARRDFTINALAADLHPDRLGAVIDPFDGVSDLAAGRLRTPLEPSATFSDDPLRMMRAARFAAQLGFAVDQDVKDAMVGMGDRLAIVSQERITDELMKILAAPAPSVGFKLLFHTGLLSLILPELVAMAGVEEIAGHGHKDAFFHTLQVVDNVAQGSGDVYLRLAALLHDIAKPKTKRFVAGTGWTFHGHEEAGARMVKGLFRRLKLPMDRVGYVEKLVRLHLRPVALTKEEVTDSAVRRLLFDAGDEIDDLMTLCRADITSRNAARVSKILRGYEHVAARLAEVEAADRIRAWRPPIDGAEIMQIAGIGPGREVGRLKTLIEDAVLDGLIPNDAEAARAYLRTLL